MRRPRLARPPVAASLILGATLAVGGGAWAILRGRISRVEVVGDSMRPGLEAGDYLLVRAGAPRAERAAGAIVALEPPPDPTGQRPGLLVKRIVGLPGEMLRVGEDVEVNERILEEPYRSGTALAASYRGVQSVAADHYFVLGDYRSASSDSRDFGTIEASRVLGVAFWRYWPPSRFGPLRRPRRTWRASDGPDGDT